MIEVLKQALEKIANTNAMDYEYQRWAKEALAIAKLESQEPLCTAAMFDDWFLAKSGLDPKTPLYIHPPQPAKPIPCANNCEATAFEIVIKNLQGEIERLKAPQRTWVGLTDEEMQQTCYETFSYDPYVVARAIEAKLKQKNGFAEQKNT